MEREREKETKKRATLTKKARKKQKEEGETPERKAEPTLAALKRASVKAGTEKLGERAGGKGRTNTFEKRRTNQGAEKGRESTGRDIPALVFPRWEPVTQTMKREGE